MPKDNSLHLADRVAIVTGANAGIGRGIAEAFAKAGAKVVVAGRTEARNAEVVDTIRNAGGEAVAIRTDVMREEDTVDLVRKTVEIYGQVDIAVANSGGTADAGTAPLIDMDTKMWRDVVWLNLDATYILYREAARQMVQRGKGGVLIGISSVSSIRSVGDAIHYSAAKAGMNALSMTLAHQLGPHGIRVNSIAPGFIESLQTAPFIQADEARAGIVSRIPMGRVGTPEELGALATFLSSDDASFITGQTIVIDGGQTPRMVTDPASK